MKKIILLSTCIALGLGATVATAQDRGGRGERPSFAELDTNGDGQLTLEELKAPMAARFADADTDGNGELSKEELVARASQQASERAAERAETMFDRLDTNESGGLSEAELALAGRRGGGGDRAERMLERADADDSGSLSEEEFEAAMEKGGKRGGKKRGKKRN